MDLRNTIADGRNQFVRDIVGVVLVEPLPHGVNVCLMCFHCNWLAERALRGKVHCLMHTELCHQAILNQLLYVFCGWGFCLTCKEKKLSNATNISIFLILIQ